ncbi:MAG: hypothetical protein RIA71_01465 [Oceanicaulis sp.]
MALPTALAVAGCQDVETHELSSDFALVAVDGNEQMSFCMALENGGFVCADPKPVVAAGIESGFARLEVCERRERRVLLVELPADRYGEFAIVRAFDADGIEDLARAEPERWPEIDVRLNRLERRYCPPEG